MKLAQLAEGIGLLEATGNLDREIDQIDSSFTYSFRDQGPYPAENRRAFVHCGPLLPEQAEEYFSQNVHVLVCDRAIAVPNGKTVMRVANTYETYALFWANFLSHPSRDLTVVAVTGTNGKTTVTHILESIFQAAHKKTVVLGTINYRFGQTIVQDHAESGPKTTPNAENLQRILASARDKRFTHVTLEASSEGLFEHRMDGTDLDVAVFTNFTPEHLEEHGDVENYFAAKRLLFSHVLKRSAKKNRAACIHTADKRGRDLARLCTGLDLRTIAFGRRAGGERQIYCRRVDNSEAGIRGTVVTPRGPVEVQSALLAPFNLTNILAAIAAASALEIPLPAIAEGVARCQPVPGRMQKVSNPLGLNIYFDWAHTVEGFRQVLQILNTWKRKGRVLSIFDFDDTPDPEKRKDISRLNAQMADGLYITLEDLAPPMRTLVRKEFEEGAKGFDKPTAWFYNTEETIRACLDQAKPGDTVVLFGFRLSAVTQAGPWLENYVASRKETA